LGQPNILPQSFPLMAEIVSPTDLAEEVLGKANEYLASGAEEVWLVFPESQWVMVLTQQQRFLFTQSEIVTTYPAWQDSALPSAICSHNPSDRVRFYRPPAFSIA
jgi:Uma2 family endonuclease